MTETLTNSLQLTNLQIAIGETSIVKGIDLTVRSGEIHAIMGPNGSGKSTLAYTLAGHPQYTVTGGDIHMNGVSILDASPDERARAGLFLAFQYPTEIAGVSLQNFLRAMWEARFGPLGKNSRFATALAFRKFVNETATKLGIRPELLQRNLNEGFSGGERKRVEILQLQLFAPQFAVLDETDSGLDIDAVQVVAKGARASAETLQTGMVVITHYQRILKFLQPQFVHVMVGGKIVESGGEELARKLEKEGYKGYATK